MQICRCLFFPSTRDRLLKEAVGVKRVHTAAVFQFTPNYAEKKQCFCILLQLSRSRNTSLTHVRSRNVWLCWWASY